MTAVVLVVGERRRQIELYGLNEDLALGFEDGQPWLAPYVTDPPRVVEAVFREEYEAYKRLAGSPTWMHLIREEVAEMFAAQSPGDAIVEASQVAALCVSLIEHLMLYGAEVWPNT